jgi:hypothetical protein
VPDIKKFGLHSLRSGGATTCANLRISDRLFKKHGRRRSETAKDGYVKDSLPTTSDTNMSLIEINIKKTIQIAYPHDSVEC